MIAARFPRAFLDVNREPYEFDPELFQDPLPISQYVFGQGRGRARNHRTHRCRRRRIYRDRLPVAEALTRVERLYMRFMLRSRRSSTRRETGSGM